MAHKGELNKIEMKITLCFGVKLLSSTRDTIKKGGVKSRGKCCVFKIKRRNNK